MGKKTHTRQARSVAQVVNKPTCTCRSRLLCRPATIACQQASGRYETGERPDQLCYGTYGNNDTQAFVAMSNPC